MRLINKYNIPVRFKLIIVFLVSMLIMLCINLYIFSGINKMMEKVDNSYHTNAELMDLENSLEELRGNVREYLSSKSSDSMEAYYTSQKAYTNLICKMNDRACDNSSKMMEKNIRNMSQKYLDLTAKAMEAKRGRFTKEYADYYSQSEVVYDHINTYIYSLNSAQFVGNTNHYKDLMSSLSFAESISVVIMILVACGIVVGVFMITANLVDPLESHLTTARLKYLQAQINPHFLFNTLNAGAQLAMMEGADRTYDYIQNVADFFRYNISHENDIATLADEVLLIDNYIYILNVRFANELEYEKIIDEELLKLPMPTMMLQPIVENAVNHGLRNVEHEKKIRLTITREEDRVCVAISDNGIGISQEDIERIYAGQKNPDNESTGIGLANVISRLKMFYGIEDVIEITSTGENQGTEVVIYIPFSEIGESYV